jgi:hypothetical protein
MSDTELRADAPHWVSRVTQYVLERLHSEGTFRVDLHELQEELGLPADFYQQYLDATQDQGFIFSPRTTHRHTDGSAAIVQFSEDFEL